MADGYLWLDSVPFPEAILYVVTFGSPLILHMERLALYRVVFAVAFV